MIVTNKYIDPLFAKKFSNLVDVISKFELLKVARSSSGCPECLPQPILTALRKLRAGTIRVCVVTEDIRHQ